MTSGRRLFAIRFHSGEQTDRRPRAVGPDIGHRTAARLPSTAGDGPDQLTSEGTTTMLGGYAPLPVSSREITQHRLPRGGDRSEMGRSGSQLAPPDGDLLIVGRSTGP